MEEITGNSADSANRLTFWRNWYMAVAPYPDEMRLAWYDAVLRYAFEGIEPEMPTKGDAVSAIGWSAVQMVRETIAISRKRKEIGELGAKQKRSKREANAKQMRSKTEANAKQTCSKPEANPKQEQVQEQEQEQVQEQEQEHNANSITATAHTRGKLLPTIEQFVEGGRVANVPEDFSRTLFHALDAAGWLDASGAHIGNWRRYLKSAWSEEQKNIAARALIPREGLDAYRDIR